MKKIIMLFIAVFTVFYSTYGQVTPKMRYEDKIRIREAMTISEQIGNKIWKGIKEVPFVVLLISDSTEFLINHPYPSNDFKLSENDTILNTKIVYRAQKYPDWYLATFPAVNGVNCIVVGTPEKTNKNSTDWTITLLHEHFHQYQFSHPDYYKSVDELELSGGDQTGMWQLNYPFPYANEKIIEQYKSFTTALFNVVSNIDKKRFNSYFKKYVKQRTKFKSLLNPADYRYLSFQIWQEGIARHTEYKFLKELDSYEPSNEMQQLKDFISFKEFKEKFYTSEINALRSSKLETDKRVCFYAIGFAEGILLDKQNEHWQDNYLLNKFYIEETWLKNGETIKNSLIKAGDEAKFRFFKKYFSNQGNHFKEKEYFSYEMTTKQKSLLQELKICKNKNRNVFKLSLYTYMFASSSCLVVVFLS